MHGVLFATIKRISRFHLFHRNALLPLLFFLFLSFLSFYFHLAPFFFSPFSLSRARSRFYWKAATDIFRCVRITAYGGANFPATWSAVNSADPGEPVGQQLYFSWKLKWPHALEFVTGCLMAAWNFNFDTYVGRGRVRWPYFFSRFPIGRFSVSGQRNNIYDYTRDRKFKNYVNETCATCPVDKRSGNWNNEKIVIPSFPLW